MTPSRPEGRAEPLRALVACGIVAAVLAGCTPVGAWLYEDPRFKLVEVQRDTISTEAHRLQFIFDGCNNNDYDLQTDSLATSLVINGQPAGQNQETSSIVLPSRTVMRLSVKLTPAVEGSGSGIRSVPFKLTNRATVMAPSGPRVVHLVEAGTVTLKDGYPVGWRMRDTDPCRPGQSKLPAAAGRGDGRPVYVPPPPPVVIPGTTPIPR